MGGSHCHPRHVFLVSSLFPHLRRLFYLLSPFLAHSLARFLSHSFSLTHASRTHISFLISPSASCSLSLSSSLLLFMSLVWCCRGSTGVKVVSMLMRSVDILITYVSQKILYSLNPLKDPPLFFIFRLK